MTSKFTIQKGFVILPILLVLSLIILLAFLISNSNRQNLTQNQNKTPGVTPSPDTTPYPEAQKSFPQSTSSLAYIVQDGNRIVVKKFNLKTGGATIIYETNTSKDITTGGAISPNGELLALTEDDGLYIIKLSSGEKRRILKHSSYEETKDVNAVRYYIPNKWSSDSQKILLSVYFWEWAEPAVVNQYGSNLKYIPTPDERQWCGNVGWTSDLNFAIIPGGGPGPATCGGEPRGLRLVNMRNEKITTIYVPSNVGKKEKYDYGLEGSIGNPIFSPDGTRIVFTQKVKDPARSDSNNYLDKVFIINRDGSSLTTVDSPEETYFLWRDNNELVGHVKDKIVLYSLSKKILLELSSTTPKITTLSFLDPSGNYIVFHFDAGTGIDKKYIMGILEIGSGNWLQIAEVNKNPALRQFVGWLVPLK